MMPHPVNKIHDLAKDSYFDRLETWELWIKGAFKRMHRGFVDINYALIDVDGKRYQTHYFAREENLMKRVRRIERLGDMQVAVKKSLVGEVDEECGVEPPHSGRWIYRPDQCVMEVKEKPKGFRAFYGPAGKPTKTVAGRPRQ